MSFKTPSEVRHTFEKTSAVRKYRPGSKKGPGREKRIQRTNYWGGNKLNYEMMESVKELVCRVKHPTGYYKYRKDAEYRISIMPWSRSHYLDIRMYYKGKPTAMGILLHLDIISVMMPDLVSAVRRLENSDGREPDKKAHPEVLYEPYTPTETVSNMQLSPWETKPNGHGEVC